MKDDLRKITLNLFSSDCDRLRQRYGYGWSEQVRLFVRKKLNELDATADRMRGVITDE